MVYKKTYRKKKHPRRKSRFGSKMSRHSKSRGLGNSTRGMHSQYATIQETIQRTDLVANTDYSQTFNLQNFGRASDVAPNFKWYRAKSVTWSYEPNANTFNGDGTVTKPYLLYLMNRTQDATAYTRAQYEGQGAVPQNLIKKLKISYKPNWCSSGLIAYTTAQTTPSNITSINATGLRAQTGWLASPTAYSGGANTQPVMPVILNSNLSGIAVPGTAIANTAIYTNAVTYNGHGVYIDQALKNSNVPVCKVTCTVVWEFKGPKIDKNITEPTDEGVAP